MAGLKPQNEADRLAQFRRRTGESGEESDAPLRKGPEATWSGLPGWTWVFMVACGAIPALNVYLHGPHVGWLGFWGAGVCAVAAKRSEWRPIYRVAACVGMTAVVWGVFMLVVLADAVGKRD